MNKILNWAETEWHEIEQEEPKVVNEYGPQVLGIMDKIKTAMASPTAAVIEAALGQMISGSWEGKVITVLTEALGIAIPAVTGITANANATPVQQASAFVTFLEGLSPKMKNAAIFKLASGIFQAIDPKLSEVNADTAAQIVYAKSVA